MDERDIFIRGEKIILKALSEEDITKSGWYGWFNDKDTTEFMQQRYFPNTLNSQIEYYRQVIALSKTKIQLGIVPLDCDHIIGVVSLSGIDLLNRKAEFSIIIGEKDMRGKGYAVEATRLIVDHGFRRLGLNKIWLGVDESNSDAINCYRKVGFQVNGTLPEDVFLDGTFHNNLIMSILARDYFRSIRA
jgi:RimJ/RimL family protein N-acetyltransferase